MDLALQPDTSRSLIYSDKNSVHEDQSDQDNQSNDGGSENKYGGNDSSFNKDYNMVQIGEFKDDKAIFKNPVVNSHYQLIERPNYLINFS